MQHSDPRVPRDDGASEQIGQDGRTTSVWEGSDPPGDGVAHAVGYGRPPQGSRFKPGRSGNPKGRPPGHLAFETLLQRELEERVSVKEQGRRRKLSKRGVIVKRLVSEAMAGSPKHLSIVLAQDPIAAEVLDEVTAALTRPADVAVKADLIRRLRAAAASEEAAPGTTGQPLPERQEGSA